MRGLAHDQWVGRRLLNHVELETWARTQGFNDLVPEAWHVTLCRAGPQLPDLNTKPLILRSGFRRMSRMGGLIVLELSSPTLTRRHRELSNMRAGRYRPHVSITPDDGRNLTDIKPYTGVIRLDGEVAECPESLWLHPEQ